MNLSPELVRVLMDLNFKVGFALGVVAGAGSVIVLGLLLIWLTWSWHL